MLSIFVTASLISVALADVADPFAHIVKRQGNGAAACSAYLSKDAACSAATPGFATVAFSSALSCYCSSGGVNVGPQFDSAFGGCLSYISTVSPAVYSSLGTAFPRSPCAAVASLTATAGVSSSLASASASRTITSSAAATGAAGNTNLVACSSFFAIDDACSEQFTTTAPFSVEASCFCYSGTSWVPSRYDSLLQGCLSYYATASPSVYSSITSGGIVTTPCARVGNVRSNGAAASTSTAARTTAMTSSSTTQQQSVVTITATPTSATSRAAAGSNNNSAGWSVALLINAVIAMLW